MSKQLMKDLIKVLNNATVQYDKGTPIMEDEQWDNLYFNLLELEKKSGIVLPDSPTIKIHFDEKISELPKKFHGHEMLSLAKTKSLDEANSFLHNKPSLAMLKMDGLTCSLRYENGKLVCAETRGDGTVGEDITHNAMRIPSIPKHISYTDTLVVDGEIICTYNNFEKFETEYKNPRNFAAGSIRLLDSVECEKRGLTFVAWDVIEGLFEFKTLSEKLAELEDLRFTVVPYLLNKDNLPFEEEVVEILKNKANSLGYPIDGLVFKFNSIAYGKSLGKTAHHFNNAIAYKFYDDLYKTTVKHLEWTMGRTGVLTPVAVLEPIEIDGTTVERASCHNITILQGLGLKYQEQEVDVFKANQIIPQIAKVYEWPYEIASTAGMEIPKICPICGGDTEIRVSDGNVKALYCCNPQCEGKLINKLNHFCGKKGLDIKGLSIATLEKLINQGWLCGYEDLFKLHLYQKEWAQLPGFGEKSINKILTNIELARKYAKLEQFISAIGIPLIGKTLAKDLANRFKTYDNFREAIDKGFDFSQINGYGPEMTKSLLTFNYTDMDILATNYLLNINVSADEVNEVNESEEMDKKLTGVTFVITGKLKNWKNRDALKYKIESLGGKVTGSVTKNTDFLINNNINSTSAKNKKAKELEVDIITEEDFIKKFDL